MKGGFFLNKLTLSMIVKNEESNIGNVLGSIHSICDEIIVVDTGSTDNTVDIAKSFGAEVRFMEWDNDFAKARNYSIEGAIGDWILWLDADDYVPESSLPLIKELVNSNKKTVYAFTVKNQKPNGTGTEFLQARLFPNNLGLIFERPVHEQIMLSALKKGLVMEPTDVVIEHLGYADSEEMKKKAERNVTILEKNLELYGEDPITFVEIGDSYAIMGDREIADKWYRKTVTLKGADEKFPDVVSQAWMGLGNSANTKGDYIRAITAFKKVTELCPGRIDVYYNLAVSYEKMGDLYGAISTLFKIFSTEPEKVKVGVDVRQAKIRGAMKIIRLSIRIGDDSLTQKNIDLFQKLLGDRLEIVNYIAIAHYRMLNFEKAISLFEESVTKRPEGNVDGFIGIILAYIAIGDEQKAVNYLSIGDEFLATTARFILFKTLLNNDYSPLSKYSIKVIESEEKYLNELFDLSFDKELIKKYALVDEEK